MIGAAEDTVGFLNSTLSTIERNILSDATSAQTTIVAAVNKVVGGIGSVLGAGNLQIPQIQLPSVSELSNITIPDTINKALQTLNNSLPTFEDVKNTTDNAIKFPFELLKVHPVMYRADWLARCPFNVWQFYIQRFSFTCSIFRIRTIL